MRKSKSLSIIMATMLATQGGGGSAVFAMKGKIQDNLRNILFFRPDLMSTLKDYLPNKIDNMTKCTSCHKAQDQVSMSQIIEEDNVELLHNKFKDDENITICDHFLHHSINSIPILNYCVMKKAMRCFKFLILINVNACKEIPDIGEKGWDCMSLAVYFGEWEMMRILEERGINKLNNPRVWGAAALAHRNKLLKQLLSKKDEIDNFDECLREAMVDAARGCNMKGVAILISNGADVNARNSQGILPLHAASSSNAFQVAKMLISKGANINATMGAQTTPLHVAVRRNAFELAELLISKGADINAESLFLSDTPLSLALKYGYNKLAKLLISNGANTINIPETKKDVFGRKCRDLANLLKSKGARH